MIEADSNPRTVPSYSADFYSDEFIRDPFPHYAAMRRLGAVIWLPTLKNFAATRFKEVREVLRNHQVFSSAQGVAADDAGCEFMKGNTVGSDPPRHTLMRATMGEPLLPSALKSIEARVQEVADELIDDLIERKNFDGVADLARHLPLTIVSEMVGLPEEGRENMLKWAAAAFDILGVQNERGREGMETIKESRRYIEDKTQPGRLKPGSWTARIYELEAQGKVPSELCPYLVRDYANPSLDTTISATGHLLYQLASNPQQWEILRNEPSLISSAVNEALRLGSPIRSFTRRATQDYELGGTLIPGGARIMALYASANRDELQYSDPDRFDLHRKGNSSHVAFGHGIHTCVGMHLARLEIESLLRAMIERVSEISAGDPTVAMNNSICAYATLPMAFKRRQPNDKTLHSHTQNDTPAQPHKTLCLQVQSLKREADEIISFELVAPNGAALPAFTAGAHIDIEFEPNSFRQYSLCNDPADTHRYRVGVLREPQSRGGSSAIHERFKNGDVVSISEPRNHFQLEESAAQSILIAGGVGITPLLAMAHRLSALGRPFELHYCVRTIARAAFLDELGAFGDRVILHVDDGPAEQQFDADRVLSNPARGSHLYCCGPSGLLQHVRQRAYEAGWASACIHFEYFNANPDVTGNAFIVVARKSGRTFEIPPDRSILGVLEEADIPVQSSCHSGVCASCLTPVLEGIPDHRDLVLTPEEKAANRKIAICCSRSLTGTLVLDI